MTLNRKYGISELNLKSKKAGHTQGRPIKGPVPAYIWASTNSKIDELIYEINEELKLKGKMYKIVPFTIFYCLIYQ